MHLSRSLGNRLTVKIISISLTGISLTSQLQGVVRSGSVADLIDAFGGGGKPTSTHPGANGVNEQDSCAVNSSTSHCANHDSNITKHSKDDSCSTKVSHAVIAPPTGGSGCDDIQKDDDVASEATTEGADSPGSSAPVSPLRCVTAGYSFTEPPILYAR